MVLRNLNSDFVGGAYVFPGGGIDPQDLDEGIALRCSDLDDARASTLLGCERGGLAYFIACLRELFEEAGLLLAAHADGRPLDVHDAALVSRLVEHRAAMNAKQRTLHDVLVAEDLVLAPRSLHYFAHWITPIGPPRRYDTRFFVAEAPEGQAPLHDDHELVGHTWVTPAEALARHGRGEMQLILPTIRNLEAIGRFEHVDELLAAVRQQVDVPTIEPRIVADGNGVRILLPGDEGFDDVVVGTAAAVTDRSVGSTEIARASDERAAT